MDASFFVGNRQRLSAECADRLIVLSAYTSLQRSGDAAFSFEQEANFWYLTGISEPDWWVIIDGDTTILVRPPVSAAQQLFSGSLADEPALQVSGVERVISRREALTYLREQAASHKSVLTLGAEPYQKQYDFVMNPAAARLHTRLSRLFASVDDCRPQLTRLRAIKQPVEVAAMRSAIQLSADAFSLVRQKLADYHHEYEIEADFTHYFRGHGAAGHAYDPIVASGSNACTLHYSANSSALDPHNLILIDIGARHQGHAADITRTYAYGEPTPRQREVHAAVVAAQAEVIALLRPGLKVKTYHETVEKIMRGVVELLGLPVARYRHYFPHAISHGLGIDVHDALGQPAELQPGMVLTVEPGIYIPEEGIGVRIEDDILITNKGHENLSAALPTEL